MLILVGIVVGLTTVLFGFGGGFVAVPVMTVVAASAGADAPHIAVATSALVMLVNAAVATAATRRSVLGVLSGRWALFALLAVGGALGAAAARFVPGALIRWGFVAYVAITAVDLLLRPGFLRPAAPERAPGRGVTDGLGLPIGALAALLGVGGSVMTVPLMRRSGASMAVATALANPLTLAIVAPAVVVGMIGSTPVPGLVGAVDVPAAGALLLGAIPVIVALRRRPPRIPDAVHAWGYLALLVASGATVALT